MYSRHSKLKQLQNNKTAMVRNQYHHILVTLPRRCFFLDYFVFSVLFLYAFLSVHGSLVVTYWKGADFLTVLYAMFYCVFVTFPCSVLGQVWCWILSIPDICHLFSLIMYSFPGQCILQALVFFMCQLIIDTSN